MIWSNFIHKLPLPFTLFTLIPTLGPLPPPPLKQVQRGSRNDKGTRVILDREAVSLYLISIKSWTLYQKD